MEREYDEQEPAADRLTDETWAASWETEDNYWSENFSSRPYSLGPDYYDRFRPAYRYGFESARHHVNRRWDDVETDLAAGWERYTERGEVSSTWEEVKAAVRDAWDRVIVAGAPVRLPETAGRQEGDTPRRRRGDLAL